MQTKIERNLAQQVLYGDEPSALDESSSGHCASLSRPEVVPSRWGFDDVVQYTMFRIPHSSARRWSLCYSTRYPTGTKNT